MTLPQLDLSSMGALTAVRFAIEDCLTPGGLTILLLFSAFLYMLCLKRLAVGWLGFVFVVVFGLSVWTQQIIGLWDPLLQSRTYENVLETVVFFISLAALAVGGLCLSDWWRFKIRKLPVERLRVRFPFLRGAPGPTGRRGLLCRFGWFLLTVGAGFLASVLFSIWPVNSLIGMISVQSFSQPDNILLAAMLLWYAWGVTIPFYVVLTFTRWYLCAQRRRSQLAGALSRIQLITAAVLMGYGGTMIWLYYLPP